jgi:hypothetical protein
MERKNIQKRRKETPYVGQQIYVDSSFYIAHARDDFLGGLAIIANAWEEFGSTWISIKENPGITYGWTYLKEQQEKLKQEYGKRTAKKIPNLNPRFNYEW